jgi:hypothetical protein
MDLLTYLIAAVAIGTLVVNARQFALQATALRLQTDALVEDRFERARQREQRRTTLFTALKAELQEIQSTAEADYVEYRGENPQSDRVRREGDSRANEGEIRHRLGFPWAPLPDNTITQAINEAALLGLKAEQIGKLQVLRRQIQRVDALVSYKVGIYPVLIQANPPKQLTAAQFYGLQTWAEDRASHLNNALESTSYSIAQECKAILESWRFE